MKRVLVTGSGGQLGITLEGVSHLYKDLSFDFKSSIELDITDFEATGKAIRIGNYHYCINCAAYTNVELAEKETHKAFSVNAEGVKNLALFCERQQVTLIHISTDYVFDGTKKEPYVPNDKPNPINEYGRSKLLGEQYIQKFLQKYYIVRTSWLYDKKIGKNFYRTILEKAKKGEILNVTDEQIGRPTDTVSLSKYLIEKLILAHPEFGIYHFTDGQTMSWYDFAKKILTENDISTEILKKNPDRLKKVKRPRNSVLATTNEKF